MNSSFQIFDAHFHIIDPRFPLKPNQGYTPEAFTCADYLSRLSEFSLCGGAVVSGSFQSFDQTYLQSALEHLGPGYVGVTMLPSKASDDEVVSLQQTGVRAIRFNLRRGGSEDVMHLDRMARRVHELVGWHVELYADSERLAELYSSIVSLPSVSIDHLGLSEGGMELLLRLVEKGVRVKASGFGRVRCDVAKVLRAVDSANPESLMFGTDLPSTRAPRPFESEDVSLVIDALGPTRAKAVLSENALKFYRIRDCSNSGG